MYIYLTFWVITLYCVVYFIDQIVPALAIRSSFGWLPLTCPHLFFCWALSSFLVPQGAPGSSFILPAQALASGISPRNPGSFYSRIVFRNQGGHPFLTPLLKQGS